MNINEKYQELLEKSDSDPLLVINSVIFLFSSEGEKHNSSKLNNIFELYFAAILIYLGKGFRRKEIDISSSLLFSNLSSDEQRAIAFSLLYDLYRVYPRVFEGAVLHKFYKLMDDVLSSTNLSVLKIENRKQSHEKIAIIEEEINKVVYEVQTALSEISCGRNLQSNMESIGRQLSKQISRAFILSRFKNMDLAGELRRLIQHTVDFFANLNSEKIIASYEILIEQIETVLSINSKNYTGVLHQTIRSALNSLKKLAEDIFTASEVNKSPNILVRAVERNYPLNELNSNFNIGFILSNEGDGIAQNVSIGIKDSTDISISNDSYLIGSIKSKESVTIHFLSTCLTCSSTALVEYTLSYSDLKNEIYDSEDVAVLHSQSGIVDWDKAKLRDPYSIQPVATEDELFGRENSIRKLTTIILAEMMGSAFIYGQKRVGKTSIAQTFLHKAQKLAPHINFISYDVGNAGTGEAHSTIDQLVKVLCKNISRRNPNFKDIEFSNLNGSLSPLANYISDIQDLYPGEKFCFVLDEFDELPSDLYSGELGNAFFQAIRSMTSEGSSAFILIGGEKIQRILTNQGTKLNKFDTIIVDYFDRLKQWDDFVELVRSPVVGILEYADEVVQKIYDVSAGNPYFTKKICQTIYRYSIDKRDSYVGLEEFTKSYMETKNNAGVQSFAHFWTDGLLSSGDQLESMQYKRKCLLIGLGKAARSIENITFKDIYDHNPDSAISEMDIKMVLNEFVSRRIIDLTDQVYQIRVKIFRDWLTDVGISEIIADTSEKQALLQQQAIDENLRVKDSEIEFLVENWPIYKNVEKGIYAVRKWLSQFETSSERRDMFILLSKLNIISQYSIQEWCRKAFKIIQDDLFQQRKLIHYGGNRKTKRDEYLVTYLESSIAKSGTGVGRMFVGINDILGTNLVSKYSIRRSLESNKNIQVVFVVDDFVGTGDSICKSLDQIPSDDMAYLIENEIKLNFIVMISTLEGERKVIEKLASLGLMYNYMANRYIFEEDLLFTDESIILTNITVKESIKYVLNKYSKRIELSPFGYGSKGLALVFETNCPNNTIPLLWSSKNGWYPLFDRT